ncbi:hypothetical protein ACS0TY_021565 [Phlomoides rotata]
MGGGGGGGGEGEDRPHPIQSLIPHTCTATSPLHIQRKTPIHLLLTLTTAYTTHTFSIQLGGDWKNRVIEKPNAQDLGIWVGLISVF